MTRTEDAPPSGEGRDEAVPRSPLRRRRVLVSAGVLVVVVVVVVLVLVGLTREDDAGPATGRGEAAAPTSSGSAPSGAAPVGAEPTGAVEAPLPTPDPSGPTQDVTELPPALPEVPIDGTSEVGNGLVATLPAVEAIQGTAVGPGNVAGPAVRVTVRLDNGTDDAVSLGGTAVNMYYGPERTPASPLEDPSRRPFGGVLAAGDTADGVYVFSIPADARSTVTIEIGYEAGANLMLFSGPID
ncbi:hypothetical protein A7K94_0202175 [Modestobacter sp. VKM Ac-2676]|nr:hypothetical protein A7K94_0202175 [Modestobacter sp. VKM Ac-2676]